MDSDLSSGYSLEERKRALKYSTPLKIEIILQIMQLIDVCRERRAFKSTEFTQVGSIFDNLSNRVSASFLKSREEIKKEQEEEQEKERYQKIFKIDRKKPVQNQNQPPQNIPKNLSQTQTPIIRTQNLPQRQDTPMPSIQPVIVPQYDPNIINDYGINYDQQEDPNQDENQDQYQNQNEYLDQDEDGEYQRSIFPEEHSLE